jgi:hypothetical protein
VGNSRPAVTGDGGDNVDYDLRKRMLAVNVLLEMPEDMPDDLESSLYEYRDRLQVAALSEGKAAES